mmetsp:Transcript_5646/g.16792  ORF Transcript_5646/g.16792 Transcript_5646/m.16792 type:complete len:86 (+) Transcript_5646:158-415(+)
MRQLCPNICLSVSVSTQGRGDLRPANRREYVSSCISRCCGWTVGLVALRNDLLQALCKYADVVFYQPHIPIKILSAHDAHQNKVL